MILEKNLIPDILKELYDRKIQSIIIEGGAKTLQSFIDADLWDEARIFTGDISFESGVKAPEISGEIFSKQNIGTSKLNILLNKKNRVIIYPAFKFCLLILKFGFRFIKFNNEKQFMGAIAIFVNI